MDDEGLVVEGQQGSSGRQTEGRDGRVVLTGAVGGGVRGTRLLLLVTSPERIDPVLTKDRPARRYVQVH